MSRPQRRTVMEPVASEAILVAVRGVSHLLDDWQELEPLMARIGDARYVLLGEASHGTHEFYAWRRLISQRLIREKGFTMIAVEGDWPDCYRINRYVKGYPDSGRNAYEVLHAFSRWPTWMWANEEVVTLVEWLRDWNRGILGQDMALEQDVRPVGQPFDAPQDAALAVYLDADAAAIERPTRLRVQVGLKGAERQGGHRPAMNLGLLVDLRGGVQPESARRIRA